jgi:phosphoserine aminotransferase
MENKQAEKTVFNFSAGPCVLPKEVLKQAQDECLSWQGTGVSVMEMSHRSKDFIKIATQAEKDFRDLMSIPDNFKVFFMQGGASLQFAAIPLNLIKDKKKTNYLTSGCWSQAAIAEAKKYSEPNEVYPESKNKFTTLPDPSNWHIEPEATYFHYCDNETVHGVEFQEFAFDKVPADQILVSDMSSNMCTRPIHWDKYGVVYAGAQKNIGPAGVCIVIVREDLIGHQDPKTPLMCDWKVTRDAPNQFHNTPSCWPIYVAGLNIAHMKKNGLSYY